MLTRAPSAETVRDVFERQLSNESTKRKIGDLYSDFDSRGEDLIELLNSIGEKTGEAELAETAFAARSLKT